MKIFFTNIIRQTIKSNPSLNKEDLISKIKEKVKKKFFLTQEEVDLLESEIRDRLS